MTVTVDDPWATAQPSSFPEPFTAPFGGGGADTPISAPPLAADPLDTEVDALDAARILGVTTNTLRQWVFRGHVTISRREGRKNWFDRQHINEVAKQRSNRGTNN